MLLMIIAALILLGLCLGSFANAVIWRVHEQSKSKQAQQDLSILKGRSMCPHCRHRLGLWDLVPALSWLFLKGKCRYCRKPISPQYPVVELATAGLFVASYLWWPVAVHGTQTVLLALWLLLLTGLMALLVYDLRWMLLPNRLIYPTAVIAGAYAVVAVASSDHVFTALLNVVLAVAVGGGLFYGLYQLSGGKWIGGGDVRLGWLLGLVAGTPGRSLLLIFLASLIGTVVGVPLLAAKRLGRNSVIPFGPLLIVAAVVVQLFGHALIEWYQHVFLSL